MYVCTYVCIYLWLHALLCICPHMCTLACVLRHTPCHRRLLMSDNFPGLACQKLGSAPPRELKPNLFLSFVAYHHTTGFPFSCLSQLTTHFGRSILVCLTLCLCRVCPSGGTTDPECPHVPQQTDSDRIGSGKGWGGRRPRTSWSYCDL